MAHTPQLVQQQRGIRYWMEQVLVEVEKVRVGFDADPVHDLRVAIRRCRSMAEGFAALDSDSTWKKMRKAAKPLFSALGDLRDIQVQMEWVEKLGKAGDPVRTRLQEHFQQREQELKALAERALAEFDLPQWQQWISTLDGRAQLLPAGGEVFKVMALESWRNARLLQSVALRNRSKAAMHSLRIGIKRFRYIVENFLPDLYEDWHRNLKKLQDALGEVHDLDVLSETARSLHVYENPQQRQHWTTLIQRERKQRVDTYREKMLGKQSLWLRWRAELPQGEALHAAVLKNFETWAQFRDPNVAHTQRVLAIALAVFDQLEDPGSYDSVALRDLLSVAVLAHEVARGRGKHHKKSVRLLDKLEPPPEWKPVHLHLAGMIARYHRGAMPRESQRTFATLSAEEKNIVVLLGGIIRLADALDYARNGATGEIQIKKSDTAWVILASGLDAQTKAAEALSSARFLFENVIGLPVAVLGR